MSYFVPEIRIYACKSNNIFLIENYKSFSIPNIDHDICIQCYYAPVTKVEWTILDGIPHIDIYCDANDVPVNFNSGKQIRY